MAVLIVYGTSGRPVCKVWRITLCDVSETVLWFFLCCSTGPFSASAILFGMHKNFSGPLIAHGTSGSLFAHFGNSESFRPVATGSAQSYDFFYFALQVRFRHSYLFGGEPMNFNGCFTSIWHKWKSSLASLASFNDLNSLRRVRNRPMTFLFCCTRPFSTFILFLRGPRKFSCCYTIIWHK